MPPNGSRQRARRQARPRSHLQPRLPAVSPATPVAGTSPTPADPEPALLRIPTRPPIARRWVLNRQVWSISQAPAAAPLALWWHSVTQADGLRLGFRLTAGAGSGPAAPVPARPGGAR